MMQRYDPNGVCPKCGGSKHHVTFYKGYWDGSRLFRTRRWIPDRLYRECVYCRFREAFAPLDGSGVTGDETT